MRSAFRLMCALLMTAIVLGQGKGWAQPFVAGARAGAGVTSTDEGAAIAPAVAISGGYQISRRARVEVEASHAPALNLGDFPACPPDRVCAAVIGGTLSVKARAFAVSGNLVSQLPVRATWLRPYLVAGLGAAFLRFEQRHTLFGFSQSARSSGPMVTAGGGVDIPLGERIALGMDLRHQWLLADERFDRPDLDSHVNVTVAGATLRVGF
jgi:hypothetical protein